MIKLIELDKTFDKTRHLFMIKNKKHRKQRIEEVSQLDKKHLLKTNKNLTNQVIVNIEKLDAFPL